jgi:signal transduction histidine kinase
MSQTLRIVHYACQGPPRWSTDGAVTHAHWIPCVLALVLPAMCGPASAKPDAAATVSATLAADGRSFSVTAPGWGSLQGGFGASIRVAGETCELASSAGTPVGSIQRLTETTPYGEAEGGVATLRFEKAQVDLVLRLGRVPGMPGLLAQAGIRNGGQQPVELLSVTPLDLTIKTGGLLAEWLITGFFSPKSAVTGLDELDQPLVVHEAGGFYNGAGKGFWFGPVGTPTAYVAARFTPAAGDTFGFSLTSEMSGARVDPGETRWGQQVVMLLAPPGQAVARWAEWVGQTHGARTTKGALSGWNSWNFLKHKQPGGEELMVVDAVRRSGGRLRPDVIEEECVTQTAQEVLGAPWLPDVVRRVGETGARFGLRLAFDPAANPADPGAATDITGVAATVRRAVHSGCRYLKISLGPATKRAVGEKRTTFEIQRADWSAIREAAGEDTYLLYCGLGALPDRAVVGCVDASRIGPDALRRTLPSIINDVRPYGQLNGRWFAVDYDVYYLAAEADGLVVGGGPLVVRAWRSRVGLSCGAAITADPWYREGYREHWRNAEVLTPPATERTEVLGFGTSKDWSGLIGHVRRDWGDSIVALVWNVSQQGQTVGKVDFAAAGMDPNRRYAVWSFWDNQFLGVVKGSWTTPVLIEAASQHLCFTDLDRTPNRPVLIGSNLHIYCGAAEIKRVTSTRAAMLIELTDAGARAGDLWVYSRWPLAFKAAKGCAAQGVVSAGENVWRISLVDRQHGEAQLLDLEVRLPITHQAWFWLVLALVLASLIFAAWRYVVGLHLLRQHGLEEERARIARDIHDDLGTSLTRVSVMADDGASQQEDLAGLRDRLAAIRAVAHEMTLSMDETVWAINPRNDTLESTVNYLIDYAEEFLVPAGLKLRLDMPLQRSDWFLPSALRHDLFLAFKEALNNIVKHAAAREVQVTLRVEPRQFRLIVQDDGRGLPNPGSLALVARKTGLKPVFPDRRDACPPANLTAGHGLDNMRERMAQLGGACRITSTPGQGTQVEFVVPVSLIARKGKT